MSAQRNVCKVSARLESPRQECDPIIKQVIVVCQFTGGSFTPRYKQG